MTEAQALLGRIAAFRKRLEETQTPASAAAPAQAEIEPATVTPASPAEPPQISGTVRRVQETFQELAARQERINREPFAHNPNDALHAYHRGTMGMLTFADRLLRELPAAVEAQLTACSGLEPILKLIVQRQDSLLAALRLRSVQTQRLDRLATLLIDLHAGKQLSINPFVDMANELLEEARRASRLDLINPLEAAGPNRSAANYVGAHALNAAAVMARLLPQDFEWAAKPILPMLATLVMDVGMLEVPPALMYAEQILTAEQRRRVELHPRIGSDIIRTGLPDSGPLADIVLAHHERPDGTGYGNGLSGEMIPVLSRFAAVADCYSAMLEPRPHRDALDTRAALAESLLMAEQGRLDRDFAEYLLALTFHPVGTVVELADGRLAVVAATLGRRVDDRTAGRPVVAVLTDADGRVQPRPEFMDLATADRGGILRSVPQQERRTRLAEWYPELCV